MAIEIDSSRALRSAPDLRGLVEAIRDAGDADEQHAVEWKGSLDLGRAAGAYAVARTILGFSNRGVQPAKRHFEGAAYLVVGVKPGMVSGMPEWDDEKLGPAIEKYVGGAEGPVWLHTNVKLGEMNVLVFTVEAPRNGDPIHTLRRAYSSSDKNDKEAAHEGAIFVRRGSRTDRANTAEIRELERRLLAGSQPSSVDVRVTSGRAEPIPVVAIRDVPHEVGAWSFGLAQRLLDPFEETQSGPRSFVDALGVLEARQPTAFRNEVAAYARDLQSYGPQVLREKAVEASFKQPLKIQLENPADEALEDVQVRISTPAWIEQHYRVPDADAPERPAAWGSPTMLRPSRFELRSVESAVSGLGLPSAQLQEDEWVSTDTFKVLHAFESVTLDDLVLLAVNPPDDAAASLRVRVTARNRKGKFESEWQLALGAIKSWDGVFGPNWTPDY